ncbi:MerC domain-containing protein [Coralloluteibacterium thermophilus]
MAHTHPSHRWLVAGDRLGFAGSLLCALHCAAMPIVLALLPALGMGLVGGVDLDQGFVLFAAFLGITMLSLGYRRHRALRPWLYLWPGIALLVAGAFSHLHDHGLAHALVMTSGGLLLAAAHLSNLRRTRTAAAG